MKKVFAHSPVSLNACVLAYLVALLAWFGVWLLLGEPHVIMIVLNRAAAWLFLPAAVFLGLGIYKKRWGLALLQVVPAAIFLFLFAPYLLPNGGSASGSDPASGIKVMTFNVRNSNEKFDAIASTIRNHQPDVICFQEITKKGEQALSSRLKRTYPWQHIANQSQGGTTAIFSRFQPSKFEEISLPPGRPAVLMTLTAPPARESSHKKPQSFSVVSAHLMPYQMKGENLTAYPSHISERTNSQLLQARRLAYEILKRKHPVILGCDANTKETCFTYRVLASHLTNAAREIGWRISNSPPNGAAQDTRIGRLDYLFFTPTGITPSTVYRIKNTAGSDHEPVLGSFYLDGLNAQSLAKARAIPVDSDVPSSN